EEVNEDGRRSPLDWNHRHEGHPGDVHEDKRRIPHYSENQEACCNGLLHSSRSEIGDLTSANHQLQFHHPLDQSHVYQENHERAEDG
ncbi:hypothetical protein PMAYCL1PPCAC_17066, partial [Pristionchus mayeri]